MGKEQIYCEALVLLWGQRGWRRNEYSVITRDAMKPPAGTA